MVDVCTHRIRVHRIPIKITQENTIRPSINIATKKKTHTRKKVYSIIVIIITCSFLFIEMVAWIWFSEHKLLFWVRVLFFSLLKIKLRRIEISYFSKLNIIMLVHPNDWKTAFSVQEFCYLKFIEAQYNWCGWKWNKKTLLNAHRCTHTHIDQHWQTFMLFSVSSSYSLYLFS